MADCAFNNQPCLWAKIGGSILFILIGSVIPFTYANIRQIDKNTTRIEQIADMQTELRANTEAVIRLTLSLENQQDSIREIKENLKRLK